MGRCSCLRDILTQLNDVVLPVASVAVPAGQLLHDALPALKLYVLKGHTAWIWRAPNHDLMTLACTGCRTIMANFWRTYADMPRHRQR